MDIKAETVKGNHKKQTRQFIHKIVQPECCLTGVPCKHLKAIRNKELANLLRNSLYSSESGPFPKSGHNRYGWVFDSFLKLSSSLKTCDTSSSNVSIWSSENCVIINMHLEKNSSPNFETISSRNCFLLSEYLNKGHIKANIWTPSSSATSSQAFELLAVSINEHCSISSAPLPVLSISFTKLTFIPSQSVTNIQLIYIYISFSINNIKNFKTLFQDILNVLPVFIGRCLLGQHCYFNILKRS